MKLIPAIKRIKLMLDQTEVDDSDVDGMTTVDQLYEILERYLENDRALKKLMAELDEVD